MALGSNANMCRLATVGSNMDKGKVKRLRSSIDEWLDDHPDACERVWDVLDTGIIYNFDIGSKRRLPKGCTSIGLLSHNYLLNLLRSSATFDKDKLRLMKAVDPKVLNKMRSLKYNLPPAFEMKGGIEVAIADKFFEARASSLGDRLLGFVIGAEGAIDWYRNGVYAFCFEEENDVLIFDEVDFVKATHVMHKPSKQVVSLLQLGVAQVGPTWTIAQNWKEDGAHVYNGKSLKADLFAELDTKTDFFKYDAKILALLGNNAWKQSFGKDMVAARKTSIAEAQKAKVAAKEALEKAQEFVAVLGKRKRVR